VDTSTDCFALLNEPRLPWLDAEQLRANFLSLSAEVHPDRVHSASELVKQEATRRYAELNAAYQCLREPKERLLHLLELELGSRPRDVQRIPPGTMDLFVEVGQVCREVDRFLADRTKTVSPMVKVQLFQQAIEWTDKLAGLQQKVNAKRDQLAAELQGINQCFEVAPAPGTTERKGALPLERLEGIYRTWSYVTRWTEQLQERIVQLAF
jgi:curved DNA-binding protein CbpA